MIKNARLDKLFTLNHKLTVYIPSTVNVNQEVDTTEIVNNCATLLSNCFGGATSTPALGFWVSDTMGLIKEKSTMIFAYCSENDLTNNLDKVIDFCEKIKTDLNQEAIAMEVDGSMYFI